MDALKCNENNHQFAAVDVTKRGVAGETIPQFKLFCVKCGEVRDLVAAGAARA